MGTVRLANRIHETTQTTGTGTYTLLGALPGKRAFADVLDGERTYYCCQSPTQWELGYGTVSGGAVPTLTRDAVLLSSDGTTPIDWPSGTRDIFCTPPAGKLAVRDEDDVIGRATQVTNFATSAGGFKVSEVGFAALAQIWHSGRAPLTVSGLQGELALPNGLKLKWGTLSLASGASGNETFLTAFATVFGVMASAAFIAGDPETGSGAVTAVASTTAVTIGNGLAGSRACFYVAVGI